MIIDNLARNRNNFLKKEIYYTAAREGMHEFASVLTRAGLINRILIPGYVGISVKEGSGIFDSVSSIKGLDIVYYRMDRMLNIVEDDLLSKVESSTLVLLVNYFGFRDANFEKLVEAIKKKGAFILEDNAHGFFTYHKMPIYDVDATVFSLHKLFPFSIGGSLLIHNSKLCEMDFAENFEPEKKCNPYAYNIEAIGRIRSENYVKLYELLKPYENNYFSFLRSVNYIEKNVPQTMPIVVRIGNRDKIYEIMNREGFGVVSLYHTMIPALQSENNRMALELSKHIMNFPVHQDVDINMYDEMVKCFIHACENS